MTEELHPHGMPRTSEELPSVHTLEYFGFTRTPAFVVEIGFGDQPIPFHGNLTFGEYVGFDAANSDYPLNEKSDILFSAHVLASIKRFNNMARQEKPGEKINFKQADAVRDEAHGREGLPLDDGVANEIYMANVVNEPFHNDDIELGDQERKGILKEARRVLANDGRLVVKVSWGDDALDRFPQLRTEQLLTETGFDIVDTCKFGQMEYHELEERYGGTDASKTLAVQRADTVRKAVQISSYFIVAKKAKSVAEGSLL